MLLRVHIHTAKCTRVLAAPDLQQELLSHLHVVRNCRFKFQRQQEPSVTLS